MAALHKERFSNRLPTKVEINNADQLRHIIASQVTEGQPIDLSLAVGGGETRNITLMPALTDTLLDILRLISTGRGFRLRPPPRTQASMMAAYRFIGPLKSGRPPRPAPQVRTGQRIFLLTWPNATKPDPMPCPNLRGWTRRAT